MKFIAILAALISMLPSIARAMDTEAKIYQIIFTGNSLIVWLDRTAIPNYSNDRFSCRSKGYVEFTTVTKEDLKIHLSMLMTAKAQGKVVGFDHTASVADPCKGAVWTGLLQ